MWKWRCSHEQDELSQGAMQTGQRGVPHFNPTSKVHRLGARGGEGETRKESKKRPVKWKKKNKNKNRRGESWKAREESVLTKRLVTMSNADGWVR